MRTVRILCLGDSLTAGVSHAGSDLHPYSTSLLARLNQLWPSTEVIIDNDGLGGDTVTPPGTYISRIKSHCKKSKIPYDWVIVLGGTNDLGQSKPPEGIIASLHKIYQIALDHDKSTHVLALTIPEAANSPPSMTQTRDAVNENISKLQWSRFHVFDLHAFFPWNTMPIERRNQIWDDGVHFTPWGYDILGNALGTSLSVHTDTESEEDWEGNSAKESLEKPGHVKEILERSNHCCLIQ